MQQLGLLDFYSLRVNGRPVAFYMIPLGAATVLYLAYRGALVVYKELR